MHSARQRSSVAAAANRQTVGPPTFGPQTVGTVLFAVLAAFYAIAFFSCRLTSVGVDPETGSPMRRTVFWLQALLPDKIAAN